MTTVDVAIPNYNYGRYLRQCVESVLAQTEVDLRILIIDNASTDESLCVARDFARRDSRVSISEHKTNLGPQASWNEAVDWAHSPYFMILCSDDKLAPGALARAIRFMERKKELSFTHGQELVLAAGASAPSPPESDGREEWRSMSGEEFIAASLASPANYINGGTMVVRTAAQKRAGYFRPHLPYTDDLEMMLRLALHGGVAETSAVQGIRRLHEANMSTLYVSAKADELRHRLAAFDSFLMSEGQSVPGWHDLRRRMRRGLAARAYWAAARDFLGGRIVSASKLLKFSLSLRPANAVVPPFHYLFNANQKLNGFSPERAPISNLFRRA